MKIIADENIPYAKEAFSKIGDVTLLAGRSIDELAVRDADLLFVRSITKVNEALLKNSRLKFAATATIGTDHIDQDYLKKRGIGFAFAPGCNANSVSEYVLSGILELSQKYSFSLQEKTIGIIGGGNVGFRVEKKCRDLGMNVVLNDPPLALKTGEQKYQPISEIFKQADIISVHVPLTKSGDHPTVEMLNTNFFKQLKPGCILFNSSRGKVGVDAALKDAVNENRIHVILDVWETEPEVNLELMELCEFSTPHVAGYSFDGKVNGTQMIYQAACKFLNISSEWKPTLPLAKPDLVEIDCSNKTPEESMLELTRKLYSINEDSQRMQSTLNSSDNISEDFDRLRKTYPVRREFQNVTLKIMNASDVHKKCFKALGFKVLE